MMASSTSAFCFIYEVMASSSLSSSTLSSSSSTFDVNSILDSGVLLYLRGDGVVNVDVDVLMSKRRAAAITCARRREDGGPVDDGGCNKALIMMFTVE